MAPTELEGKERNNTDKRLKLWGIMTSRQYILAISNQSAEEKRETSDQRGERCSSLPLFRLSRKQMT